MKPFRIANESDLVGVVPDKKRWGSKNEDEEDIEEQRRAFTKGIVTGRAIPSLPEPKKMGMS